MGKEGENVKGWGLRKAPLGAERKISCKGLDAQRPNGRIDAERAWRLWKGGRM
jgi:hypothetical protein